MCLILNTLLLFCHQFKEVLLLVFLLNSLKPCSEKINKLMAHMNHLYISYTFECLDSKTLP